VRDTADMLLDRRRVVTRDDEHAPKIRFCFRRVGLWCDQCGFPSDPMDVRFTPPVYQQGRKAAEAIPTVSLDLTAHEGFPALWQLGRAADPSNSTLTTVAAPFKKRGIIHVSMKRGVIMM
jgi:hypothetical protein